MGCGTLHWLLEEPLVNGSRLDISGVTTATLSRALISSRFVTLQKLVNIAGTNLSLGANLAAGNVFDTFPINQRARGNWGSTIMTTDPTRKGWVMFMCAHVYDVALCGNTVKKCGSRSLTGWPPLLNDLYYLSLFLMEILQETHSDEDNEVDWGLWWKEGKILSHGSNISAGVVFLFSPNVTAQIFSQDEVEAALRSNPSYLRELNLSRNKVGDSGVKCLSAVLENPHCKLEILRLFNCGVSDEGCAALASALRSNPSHLRDLYLSLNKVGDTGVKCLSAVLKNPHCKLEKLRLLDCGVSDEGCAALASALRSNPSHLRDLDLSGNKVGDSGVKCLSAGLENPHCKLEILRKPTATTVMLQRRWISALTSEERVQLMNYQHREAGPAEDEPFPQLNIAPGLDRCEGLLLECRGEGEMDFGSVMGKLLYRACVKVLNKKKLNG
ncbi:NACHT, LRR and PYD domains-containing protein 12-like [Silurus meridionalis]|nr:NACHT, LRR and PYD domains-containing protein 12-like [Silurus meridionalis]